MLNLQSHSGGTILPVVVRPGARKDAICGLHGGELKLSVAAPPDKGKANDAVIELLADVLGLRKSQIELLGGKTSRKKRILIRALTPAQLAERLAGLSDDE